MCKAVRPSYNISHNDIEYTPCLKPSKIVFVMTLSKFHQLYDNLPKAGKRSKIIDLQCALIFYLT